MRRLDRVLEKPALSLIHLADEAAKRAISGEGRTLATVPTTIDERLPRLAQSLAVHAVATSAVQRLEARRRRFPWLRDLYPVLARLHEALPASFLEHPALKSRDPLGMLDALHDSAFGTLSPVTTSEVFWLLVRAGEKAAHGDLGFLALFGLLWALKRRLHGPFELGASLGSWRPTVAVTARCLFPILHLNGIVRSRASLWLRARDISEDIEKYARGRNQFERWKFASELDRLSGVLHSLAVISIKPQDFHDTAYKITNIASPLRPNSLTAPLAPRVRAAIRELFALLRDQNAAVLAKAEHATSIVQKGILGLLATPGSRREALGESCKLIPDWKAQYEAAEWAHEICADALRELQNAVGVCDRLPRGDDFTHAVMIDTFNRLAAINDRVHTILGDAIETNVEWCVRGVTREVALASAKNDTDFDATELLSGIVIAERTDRIKRALVNDAIRLSLRVARDDGSWWSTQPVFLEKRVLGVWPSTPDVVLLLATAVKPHPSILCADPYLLRFVGWLEGRIISQDPAWWKRVPDVPALWGWASEAREPGIDVYTTAQAVKALLVIRGIIEDRLWSICEERFTVMPTLKGLPSVDPVDLGARHEERLQTQFVRNAARARLEEPNADYSYILHGPPGSSKSTLAYAIGREMWRIDGTTRFIRITPADFTRRGELGLDVEARFIFRLLSCVRGVTVLFDEIDDLLRLREIGAPPSFIRLVIPGMLNRLQDLRDAASRQEICFILGTNYIDQIEPALTRPGRIDAAISIPYPDAWSRECILERIAGTVTREVKEFVVANTPEWPWSTYRKLCDHLSAKSTLAQAEEFVRQLRLEFQPPDYYYFNEKRWMTTSPLVTEFVHGAFAMSKNADDCRKRVRTLMHFLEGKDGVRLADLSLLEKFETEWRREGRS
ncbi:MAG TPA: ATP-binding protein [Thermoanaerobaculia bacterium]|nr:ATP-binding protein [Thermoanaerobaculia bacterium]